MTKFTTPALDNDTLHLRLSQGVGNGGTRGSLTKCATRYREFLSVYLSEQRDDSLADAIEKSKQDLERELLLYQVEFRKTSLSLQAILADAESLNEEIAALDRRKTALQNFSKKLSEELPPAKRARRNKEEHEALAKMANTRPSRRVLTEKMKKLEKEQLEADSEAKRIEDETRIRESQFHLLLQSMMDLKRSLTGDDKKKEQST